jgi:branched-chain amino acid transport system permease protein
MDYYLLAQVVNGLIFGLIYALIALGLTIVFSIMRVVNFSHGEFYMIGGYTLYALTAGAVTFLSIPLSLPTIVGLPLAMIAVAVFSVAVERGLLRPVYTVRMDRPEEYAIILTFGLSLFLQYGALTTVGPYEMTPGSFWDGSKHIFGDLYLAGDRLFAAGTSALLIAITLYCIYGTWTGRALMATAQNRVGSTIVGINTIRMNVIAMALAGLLAGAAGAAMAPIFLVYPDVGQIPVIKAFVIIVLGGMGSIPGAVIAAIILGLVESLGSIYLSVAYRDVFAFLVLMASCFSDPMAYWDRKNVAHDTF